MCTTVPTSSACRFSSGRCLVSTTQSCSLIFIQPPKATLSGRAAQLRLQPVARQSAPEDGGRWDCKVAMIFPVSEGGTRRKCEDREITRPFGGRFYRFLNPGLTGLKIVFN